MNLKYKNQIKIILFIVCTTSALYFLVIPLGFIFPVTDIPQILCIKGCSSLETFHSPMLEDELLNYNQTAQKIIDENIDKAKG